MFEQHQAGLWLKYSSVNITDLTIIVVMIVVSTMGNLKVKKASIDTGKQVLVVCVVKVKGSSKYVCSEMCALREVKVLIFLYQIFSQLVQSIFE